MFRIEREFGVKLTFAILQKFLRESANQNPPPGEFKDIQVADLVRAVEHLLTERQLRVPENVLPRVQQFISECLACPLSDVTPEAWLVRDLGME